MAYEDFDGLAIAVGVQSDFETINDTIRDLAGVIDETDGCVLGDRESGDADSGISSPDLAGVYTCYKRISDLYYFIFNKYS